MNLRDAAQAALNAMQSFENGTNGLYEGEFAEEIAALKAALAEPEPTLNLDTLMRCIDHHAAELFRLRAKVQQLEALPQRKPLSEEEIRDLWSWSMTAEAERTANTQQHAFARAIEKAHGIGEKE